MTKDVSCAMRTRTITLVATGVRIVTAKQAQAQNRSHRYYRRSTMNIETDRTLEKYNTNRHRLRAYVNTLDRSTAQYARWQRLRVSTHIRTYAAPLSKITVQLNGTSFNCHADWDAIRSFREDGYGVEVIRSALRDTKGARQIQLRTFTSSLHSQFPDPSTPEPWLVAYAHELRNDQTT